MKKICLYITAITFFPLFLAAQPLKKAKRAMDKYNYSEAIIILKKAVDKDKYHDAAVPLIAECYRKQHDIFNTRAWYSRAVTLPDAKPETFLYCARAYQATGDYKAARQYFLKYDSLAPGGKGKQFAGNCDSVEGHWKNIKPGFEVKSIDKINTDQSDFGPAIYKGNLVFTSDYPYSDASGKNKYGWTGRGYLDIVKATPSTPGDYLGGMSKPSVLDAKLNQVYHDGPATFTAGGDTIFFTRSYKDKAKKKDGFKTNLLKIFYATRGKEGWSEVQPFYLNSPEYSLGHPAVTADGEVLYFASNMPGGYGGTDLWMCRRDTAGWSKPFNLGKMINTSEDEMFPYIKGDGSLFFASNGQPGYGAMDIFVSKGADSTWSTPVNLHPPVNSSFDDFALAYAPGYTTGFFSSNRPGGKGNDDIYGFGVIEPEPIVVIPPTLMQGYVKDRTTLAPVAGATVFIMNPATGKVKILKTDVTGLYSTPVEGQGDLVVKAMKNGYIADCLSWPLGIFNPGIVLNAPRDLLLDKLEVNRIFTIENIYYDFDKYNIRADAKPELDKLIRIMKENAIKVELGSHTDSRGSFKYNEKLAQNRAESAVAYLTGAGIHSDRLIAKGYGEYKLINKCADGVSCTEPEHQANRRTEFKVLEYVDVTAQKDFFNPDLLKQGEVIDSFLLPSGFFTECLLSKPPSPDKK